MNKVVDIQAYRRAAIAKRTPQAETFDRRAVCAGLVAQIAVAEAYGRKIVAIRIGHVAFARVVAAYDMKIEPPPDKTMQTVLAMANVIGLSLACGVVPDEMAIDEGEARAAFWGVKMIIDQQPASRFMARVEALQMMVEPGWRKLGHG